MTFYSFTQKEIKDTTLIILVLSLMFSILSSRFSDFNFLSSFILFIIFFILLFFSRLLFMKFIAYRMGFAINLYQTSFSKWGFKKYENVKAYSRDRKLSSTNQFLDLASKPFSDEDNLPRFTKKSKYISGIPSLYLVSFLYIISFGLLIYPAVWRYKIEKINHRFIGTKHKFENSYIPIIAISDQRILKVLFMGYVYYFIFAIFMKLFLPTSGLVLWFYFAIFWIAFTTLLPLLGTEGYDLFARGRFAYISAITILSLGMLSIFIFSSVLSITLISIPIILLVLSIIYYKNFL